MTPKLVIFLTLTLCVYLEKFLNVVFRIIGINFLLCISIMQIMDLLVKIHLTTCIYAQYYILGTRVVICPSLSVKFNYTVFVSALGWHYFMLL